MAILFLAFEGHRMEPNHDTFISSLGFFIINRILTEPDFSSVKNK